MRCCPPPEAWVVRAQPWLGTLVEVSLPRTQATERRFAAAFAAIADVHLRLHTHGRRSELVRIARHAHRRAVVVSRDTHALLRLARRLAGATQGAFAPLRDVHGAGRRAVFARRAQRNALADLLLLRGRRVRSRAALSLDLGGFAKGHAVDRAVAALRGSGATAGRVNAGGDLRVFGADHWLPVRVRLPHRASLALPLFELCDAAVATSADYFRDAAATLLDTRSARRRRFGASISVAAPTCALADALTKVVALRPARAADWLARFGATAFRIEADGRTVCTTLRANGAHWRLPA